MRLFVAINLPDDIRRGVWEAVEPLRAQPYPIRWVSAESLHLTLKFLGETAPEREGEIVAAVEAAVIGAKRFTLPVEGFGVFPSRSRPRVAWVGCAAVPPLELLQDCVEREMERLGFSVEGRPFRPHVTIGRVRRGAKPASLSGLAATLEDLRYNGEAPVDSLDLMQSTRTQGGGGVRYSVRHAAELAE